MTTLPVRFVDNDYGDFATITGEALAAFPVTNAANSLRSKVWKPPGTFRVTAAKNLVYINDGADKTVTLTVATYTYATLATHIQTQLNASSAGWTVTYDTAGGTYKFTISRSTSGSLRFTQTTNAAWDMLGYTLTGDTAGTTFVAQEQRNHTEERYQWALPIAQIPTFLGVIGPISETFTVSESATATIKANNMPVWDSPDLTVSLDVRDSGILKFLSTDVTAAYNYFCFEVIDRTNPLGPEGLKFGRIWLGDYQTISTSNVARGFLKSLEDPSTVAKSESGVRYVNVKPKYKAFRGMEIQNLVASERYELEAMFDRLGVGTNFFISLDPTLCVSEDLDELTFYAYFEGSPNLSHLITDYYSLSFEIREAV